MGAFVLPAAVQSSASPPPPTHWLARGVYPTVPYAVHALSCPTVTLCLGVGVTYADTGLILRSTDGGTHWLPVALPSGTGELGDVSCGSPTMCEATVLNASFTAVQVIGTTDGGTSWHAQDVDTAADVSDIETVRCFSSLDCVATGSGNNYEATIILTTDGGATWASISPFGGVDNYGIEGVACSSATTCLVTGWEGGQTSSTGVAAKTTDGGLTWTQETLPSDVQVAWELACTSATVCESPAETATNWVVLGTTDGGTTWTEQAIPSGASPLFIECPAASTCFTSGYQHTVFNTNAGLLLTTTDGGSTWTNVPLPASSADAQGLACTSATTCVVAGDTADAVPQLYKVTSGVSALDPPLTTGITALSSISCASASSCEAGGSTSSNIGQVGAVLSTATAGRTWRSHVPNRSSYEVWSVACPTPSTCFDVAPVGEQGARDLERTTDGGASWKAVVGGSFVIDDVTCRAVNACIAYGSGARYLSPATHGAWRHSKAPKSLSYLVAVSCPTATECVGVAQDSHQRAIAARSTDGGATWTAVKVPTLLQMYSIQCTSASFCVAAGYNDSAFTPQGEGSVEFTTDGGLHWHVAAIPASAPGLNSVGCLAADRCFAAGNSLTSPVVLRSVDDGKRWSYAPAAPGTEDDYGLTCGRSGCWMLAVTASGTRELEALR